MRWIKKDHSLKISRTEGRLKGKLLQNFRRSSKLADNVIGKASAEKAWVLYEFPFRLNPSDKPNDVQTWKNYWSLYTEDQFQANSEKKMMGHFRGKQDKAHQILAGCKPEKLFVWKLCMRHIARKLKFIILKFNETFINKSHGDTKRRCAI